MTLINIVELLSQYSICSVLYKQMRDADVVKLVHVLQCEVKDRETTPQVKATCLRAVATLVTCTKERECIKSTSMEVLPRYSFPMLEAYMWFPHTSSMATIYNGGADVSTVTKFCEWFYRLSRHRKAYVCDQILDDVNYQLTHVWASYSDTLKDIHRPSEPLVNRAPHIKDVKVLYKGEVANEYCFWPIANFEVSNMLSFATKQAVMMAIVLGRFEPFALYPEVCFVGSPHMQRFDCRVKFGSKTWVRHRKNAIPFMKEVNSVVFEVPVTDENTWSLRDVYYPSISDKHAILAQPVDCRYRCRNMLFSSRSGWNFDTKRVGKVKCTCSDKTHGPPPGMFDVPVMTDVVLTEADFNDGYFIPEEPGF
jgi:hypothetical protein